MLSLCIVIHRLLVFFRVTLKHSLDFHFLTLLCLSVFLSRTQAKIENRHLNSNFIPAKNYSYSLESLDELAYSDLLVARALINFQEEEKIQSSKLVQKYLDDFEQASGLILTKSKYEGKTLAHDDEAWQLQHQAQKISDNAVSAYKLILRTALYWPKLYKIIKEPDWPVKQLKREEWPTKKDVQKAANGIFDAQVFYNINVSEFSEGKIMGISTGVKLSVKDCLDLGLHARRLGYYAQAIEWLEFVQKKLLESMKEMKEKTSTSDLKLLERAEKYLEKVIDEHDYGLQTGMNNMDFWNPKFFQAPLRNFDPSEGLSDRKIDRRKLTSADTVTKGSLPFTQYDFEHFRHFDLCRGKNFQTEAQKSRLFCWKEFHIHKKYLIGPLKMEFLSREPDIVQIYEALSDSTIEKMKKLVAGTYGHSICPSERTDVLQPRDWSTEEQQKIYREIQSAYVTYINDIRPEVTKNGLESYLTDSEAMSDLKVSTLSSAFLLRLVSYTFASVYKLHQDNKARPTSDPNRYRFATLLYYLSDVQVGGQTAFPRIGVAAKPVKGSVLLWFNLYGNDADDDDLVHGSCAPLLGRKYVATKWIKTFDQFLKYPCPLHPNQRFTVKVNGK